MLDGKEAEALAVRRAVEFALELVLEMLCLKVMPAHS